MFMSFNTGSMVNSDALGIFRRWNLAGRKTKLAEEAASALKQASAAVGRQMPVDAAGRMDQD